MTEKVWSAVDEYYGDLFAVSDPVLTQVLVASDAGGLPAIQVSPLQGRMLMLLAQAMGARRILEIGTLGGYSTIWLARALPADGKLVTLEFAPRHAEVARANIAMAGFAERVEVQQGAAADTLAEMIAAKTEPFDLIFIDADKNNYDLYLEHSLALVRPGSLIVADNMVRSGAVVDGASKDANVQGVRRFNDLLAKQPHIVATAIQTVGDKGYDGFVLARVTS
jgi:predicted O-methyltransferase YrrM